MIPKIVDLAEPGARPPRIGEFAPWFVAPTHTNPRFNFSIMAGRYVLLAFLPQAAENRDRALATVKAQRNLFDGRKLAICLVTADPAVFAAGQEEQPGLRWFLDTDGAVSRLYGALAPDGAQHPGWVLTDPDLRLLDRATTEETPAFFQRLAALPPVADHAGVDLYAPVLIVPRVLEPAVCRRLIGLYEAKGGEVSGIMRDVGGRTMGILDDSKRRKDVAIEDPGLRDVLVSRIRHRLLPEIRKAFQFHATRIERYIVACYDARDGGYFRPHRDNTSAGTAHRRFAVSINLNAEQFTGGDLRFPEFGPRTYRPPTGGAVVFCCSLMHEATPVTAGRRYATLPFLYDEEGARLREANLGYMADS